MSDAIEAALSAVAKEVYQDGLQPSIKQVGKTLETITKLLPLAVTPVDVVQALGEKGRNWILGRLAQKLSSIPSERIIRPSLHVAGRALESCGFAAEDADLREMYANLLATSMDAYTAKNAHPGFVKVIEQISPDEARLLRWMRAQPEGTKFLSVDMYGRDPGTQTYFLHKFSLLGEDASCTHSDLTKSYLENLLNLGLFELAIESQGWVGLEPRISTHQVFLRALSQATKEKAVVVVSRLVPTQYGSLFMSACVSEIARPAGEATD